MKTRIYPSFKALLAIYVPVYLIVLIVFYLIVGVTFPPTLTHYLISGGWTILTIFYLIYGYKSSYYELNKHELIHTKGGTRLIYPFKDIVYIDEVYSDKKLSLRFVTRKGDERYLAHDPKRIIYSELKKRVPVTLTKSELLKAYPKLKL